MGAMLTSLRNTIAAGFALAILLDVLIRLVPGDRVGLDGAWWTLCFRWLHVMSGTMWIGLLWYFNFVQIPNMGKIPDDQKPAVTKVIAPEALFWFRWGAMATIVTGLILAWLNDYLLQSLTLGAVEDFAVPKNIAIGIGMWLGTIMWFNVWFVIWPNQQKALNIANVYPDLTKEARGAAGRTAMLFSRTNTLLSIPMLFSMVSAQNLY